MEFWLTALFFSTLHNFDLNSFCRGFFFDFVFGQTVNQMTDTYRLSIHRPGGAVMSKLSISCSNWGESSRSPQLWSHHDRTDLSSSVPGMKPDFYYLHRVRIMQSNQNEVHVKIFSRSWDKWGNKSPRGRCAEILTECLIMSWENGPDAISINSQRNCSGRHFCSNNTMTAVWQCTLFAEKWTFWVGSGVTGAGLERGRGNRNKGCAI